MQCTLHTQVNTIATCTCKFPPSLHSSSDSLKVVVLIKDTGHLDGHGPGQTGPIQCHQAVHVAVVTALGQLAVFDGQREGADLLHLRLLIFLRHCVALQQTQPLLGSIHAYMRKGLGIFLEKPAATRD